MIYCFDLNSVTGGLIFWGEVGRWKSKMMLRDVFPIQPVFPEVI